MTTTHVSPFAGSWYPGQRAGLERLIERLFETSLRRTGPDLLPEPLAFVVPHAGLAYSGAVAAAAYRCLQAASPRRVFLLGFAHRGGSHAVEIPAVGTITTPLGDVKLDAETMRALASEPPFSMTSESRVCDHSVEIQLPLLQMAAPGARVVPVYVGRLTAEDRRVAAQTLAREFRRGDVLLASSDLTHYGHAFRYEPFPAGDDTSRRLLDLDTLAIEAAGGMDARFFLETLHQLHSTVCGSEPIALLIETLNALGGEDVFQQTLDYQTSGEMTGDFTHSVSYGALGYFRAESFCLDQESRDALLASARATLRRLRETGERKPVPPAGGSVALSRRAVAFVSLHHHGDLFGCIGSRTADRSLAESAPSLTLAALDDSRFWPRTGVPEGLEIEISVLTPFKRIRDWQTFKLGRDGALLDYEGRSGLLLPQVANKGIHTGKQFLELLARKAGLWNDAYRDSQASLYVFRAQVFGCRDEDVRTNE